MQASILNLEGLESKRDRKMILREEKLKKEKKEGSIQVRKAKK